MFSYKTKKNQLNFNSSKPDVVQSVKQGCNCTPIAYTRAA